MKSLFRIVCFSLLITLSGCKKDPEIIETESPILYSYYVAGHTYGAPGVNNVGVHPPFREKFDLLNDDLHIEFGIYTGDIVQSGTEQNWDEIDDDLDLLDHPVYFAAGNHDIDDRPLYEERYGTTYYSFIENSDLFIVLDPNLDNWNISGEQLEFLEEVLNTHADVVDNINVFFHQLLWWSDDNIYQNVVLNSLFGRDDSINFWTEVEPLFSMLPNKTFMFAGDVGAFATGSEFMFHQYSNNTLIASGMGGGNRDNFVIVDVHEDKTVSYRLIAINGNDIDALGKLEDYILP